MAVRSLEIMGAGERADFDAVYHPRARNREARREPLACREPGPAGFYATALWLRGAFSGIQHRVNTVVAEGDLVCLDTVMSGRQVGPFVVFTPEGEVAREFPSYGRTFEVVQTHWIRIENGLVVEHWAARDDLSRAQQLGWIA
ncbi:ester cyclase [Nocardia sp. NEAU-G5]|uniref:Ester cyclase n=1 Tax=Nocardia albiluteola TaxID=2842303 RepID=A0ABS6AQ36_9NOCA|nr:ester cyclase [Nocardia albiluteola]MBU3060126.1 ester cyclase [Nocardia albiluteola]